jgi:hypothetical protein
MRVFTAMALVIIILSILVRKNANGMLPLQLSPFSPIFLGTQPSLVTLHRAIRKDAPSRRTEVPITRTQMIAWVLSFVQIILSITAMGVTLSYMTDRDRENGYNWDEWGLWVVYIYCLWYAILAVSSLGSLVWG